MGYQQLMLNCDPRAGWRPLPVMCCLHTTIMAYCLGSIARRHRVKSRVGLFAHLTDTVTCL